jgi:long-subunit acyl-CoA synthetase (AMP-forming)
LARAGAILIRFHVSVKTGDDIKYLLRKGTCRWFIVHPGTGDENYHLLQLVFPNLTHLQLDPNTKPAADDLAHLQEIFTMSSASYPGTISVNSLFDDIQGGDMELVRERQATVDNDDIQACHATSGTTGRPKLVTVRFLHTLIVCGLR